jgi:hypothetical protein
VPAPPASIPAGASPRPRAAAWSGPRHGHGAEHERPAADRSAGHQCRAERGGAERHHACAGSATAAARPPGRDWHRAECSGTERPAASGLRASTDAEHGDRANHRDTQHDDARAWSRANQPSARCRCSGARSATGDGAAPARTSAWRAAADREPNAWTAAIHEQAGDTPGRSATDRKPNATARRTAAGREQAAGAATRSAPGCEPDAATRPTATGCEQAAGATTRPATGCEPSGSSTARREPATASTAGATGCGQAHAAARTAAAAGCGAATARAATGTSGRAGTWAKAAVMPTGQDDEGGQRPAGLRLDRDDFLPIVISIWFLV